MFSLPKHTQATCQMWCRRCAILLVLLIPLGAARLFSFHTINTRYLFVYFFCLCVRCTLTQRLLLTNQYKYYILCVCDYLSLLRVCACIRSRVRLLCVWDCVREAAQSLWACFLFLSLFLLQLCWWLALLILGKFRRCHS